METAVNWVEALVDCPGAQGLYTYSVPPDWTVAAGDILSVPFGHQRVGAIAIHIGDGLPEQGESHALKPIESVVCSGLFPDQYWQFLDQVADYYCAPLIAVVKTALPPGLLARGQRRVKLNPKTKQLKERELLSAGSLKLLQWWEDKGSAKSYSWRYLA